MAQEQKQEKPQLESILTYTGKLNRVEKMKVAAGMEAGKSLGQILDDITLFRDRVRQENLLQDNHNSMVKNPFKAKNKVNINKDSQTNQLNSYEKKENQKNQIRAKTDEFINLPKAQKKKRQKDLK